jgi:hypothetical protein
MLNIQKQRQQRPIINTLVIVVFAANMVIEIEQKKSKSQRGCQTHPERLFQKLASAVPTNKVT